MKKKFVSLILLIITIVSLSSTRIHAADRDKTIIINMNRTNLDYMENIPLISEELSKRGYIGLMNIRGDGGNDDKRAYATLGAGRRANISSSDIIDFKNITNSTTEQYINTTNLEPKDVNLLSINRLISYNEQNGQYGSTLGSMGQALSDNNISVAVLGNADTGEDEYQLNRNIGLFAMDNSGRINMGNVDNLNIPDTSMPFGLKTDYDKLIDETIKYYHEADVIIIELGDTHRLDLYRDFLNDESYEDMKEAINSNINSYLSKVFDLAKSNDKVYILSAFPSNLDYQNKKRLSPVIKFDGDGKGLLYSPSTKREGIIANVDVAADILSTYVLKSDSTVGKSFDYIDNDNNIESLNYEYNKIVSIASVRSNIISFFISIVTLTWIVVIILLLFSNYLPTNRNKIFTILKEVLKFGMVMPLVFLLAPIFKFTSPGLIMLGIILTTLVVYGIGYLLFKNNDNKQMLFFTSLTLLVIVVDCITGTPLMKNSILSYDAIVGARYYGMGNEYQGIVIGTALFTFTTLLTYNKIPKWSVAVLSVIVLLTTASPSMGANVGASISEFVAFLTLIFLIYDIKIDFKKILFIGLGVLAVIGLFIIIDIVSGSDSHLSLFVGQIMENGPSAIIETFARKITMNLKLARTSLWVNILIASVSIITILIFKPNKQLKTLYIKYPLLFKGFIANFIGCIITLLVNDSGIVSAATASLYIIIPIILLTINLNIEK